jgi:methionine-rich copper-binding protein CopC
MRKSILAATLTVALIATADAHAAVKSSRSADPSVADRAETPITRIIKKVKRLVGIVSNELPSDPIPHH